jgi:hypothetical protein
MPCESKMYYTFWACICNLSYLARNEHAPCMLSSVVCLAVPSFSTLSHKQHNFQGKNFKMKCVFWFFEQILYETFLILEELCEIRSKMFIGLHVKYPLFLSDFNESWNFSIDFRKIHEHQISRKSVQWEPSCSMQTADWNTDGRTDTTKLTNQPNN